MDSAYWVRGIGKEPLCKAELCSTVESGLGSRITEAGAGIDVKSCPNE